MARILFAEDDDDIRDLVALTLRKGGHAVVTTHNGTEAWATIREQPFELVVLDSMMPGLTGDQVTTLIRDSEEHVALKVMMLSAKAREDEIQQGYDAGVDLYVTKPLSPRGLVEQVAALTS